MAQSQSVEGESTPGSFESWLRNIGLENYAAVFQQNEIDFDVFRTLSDSDLTKMGLPLGARKRFLQAVEKLTEFSPHVAGPAIAPSHQPVARPESAEPTGERRQLTVLFCDKVGFTELANRVDPEVLQKIIRAYEDECAVCITRYEGYCQFPLNTDPLFSSKSDPLGWSS